MDIYFYLHGFASSPQSQKAQFLKACFQQHQIELQIPDLNQPSFLDLTLTRQIEQAKQILAPLADQAVTLIGSSFGGLTAAWVAEQCPQVQRLILLAPAFDFLSHWTPKLGSQQMRQWRQAGQIEVYHHGFQTTQPLRYDFIKDAIQYDEEDLQRSLPTLLLHGRQDDVIPIQSSRDHAAARSWIQLIELEGDHGLVCDRTAIWDAIQAFCQLC
ncbi:MAG: YqiA/YcfP family alpha/beta fold hydrolase [Thainema sp.]